MSGGHFDYAYSSIELLSDLLQQEIDCNNNTSKNELGEERGRFFSEKCMEEIKKCHKIISTASVLAREIDWLYSYDHGEESFCEIVKPHLNYLCEILSTKDNSEI